MKKILGFFLVLFVTLPTFFAILKPGMFESHDGTYHIIRIGQMYDDLKAGQIPARWASSAYYGLGQPVFVANFQLPYYLGAFFHLTGISLADSLKFQLIMAAILSGFFTYLFLERLFGVFPAVVGVFIYTWSPYHFADTYTRAAVGEVWIFVLLPLLFYLLTFSRFKDPKAIIIGSFIWGLAVLSHTTFIICLFPWLLVYSLYLGRRKKSVAGVKYFLGISIAGFVLSSFCWLPAVFERQYLFFDRSLENFYQHQFISVFQLLHIPKPKVSIVSILRFGEVNTPLLAVAAVYISLIKLGKKIWRKKNYSLAGFFLISCFILLFLISPQSRFVWEKISILDILMFPWRLLLPAVFCASVLTAFIIASVTGKVIRVAVGILTVFLIIITNNFFLNPGLLTVRSDDYYRKLGGDTIYFEDIFMPKTAVGDLKNYAIPVVEAINSKAIVENIHIDAAQITFNIINPEEKAVVKIGQLNFPGWKVNIDGVETPISGEMVKMENGKEKVIKGLISFSAPKGFHHIVVRFTETPARKISNIISFCSLFVGVGLLVFLKKTFIRKKRLYSVDLQRIL